MVSEARAPRSVLVGIELAIAGHHHRERPQRVQHLHGAGVMGDHLRQPPVGHRAFVEIRADQGDTAVLEPCIHRLAIETTLGLLPTEEPAGAVHRRVQRRLGLLAVDSLDDHRVITHRAADEATLARKGRRGAFAHHPEISTTMVLPPRIVVVVMDHVGDGTADDLAYPLDHPFAAGVGIATSQLHGGDIAAPKLTVLIDHRGRDIHAVLAAGSLQVACRAGVTQPATAEVDADPDVPGLVAHEVDVVVSRSDGAELRHRLLPVLAHVRFTPSVAVVEQFMLDALVVRPADAKGNDLLHVPDDLSDTCLDRSERCVEPHGHVAAADIEPDARDADLFLVGDHAADWLRIAEVAVSADDAGDDVTDSHAVAHLRNRGFIVVTKDLERTVLELRRLRSNHRDLCRCRRGLPGHVLLAGRVAKRAPCRHRLLAWPLNAGIRIKPSLDSQRAGALLVWIGSHFDLPRDSRRLQLRDDGRRAKARLSSIRWSAWCDLNTRSPASKAGRDDQTPLHAVNWPSRQDSNLHAFAFVARCSSSRATGR